MVEEVLLRTVSTFLRMRDHRVSRDDVSILSFFSSTDKEYVSVSSRLPLKCEVSERLPSVLGIHRDKRDMRNTRTHER